MSSQERDRRIWGCHMAMLAIDNILLDESIADEMPKKVKAALIREYQLQERDLAELQKE